MNGTFTTLRRLAGRFAALTGLVLALGLVALAVHHHEDGDARHPCAVCTAGHAPAVSPDAAVACAAPERPLERLVARSGPAPAEPYRPAPEGRGPPLA